MSLEERQFRVFTWGMAAIAVWSLIYLGVLLYHADRQTWIAFAFALVFNLAIWSPIYWALFAPIKTDGKAKVQ